MPLDLITKTERAAAIESAIDYGRDAIGEGRDFVHPRVCVGAMDDYQWGKLAQYVVAGWMFERSRQLGEERVGKERPLLTMGNETEPAALGSCRAILPALAEFVTARDLADKTISQWEEIDILLFVYNAADMLIRAEAP